MKKLLILIVSRFYKPIINYYVSRPSYYTYDELRIIVFPGVFHPRFFFSTKLLLGTLKKMELKNKSLLELGAGSGLISIFAAQKGAIVTASDISSISIKNIGENQKRNSIFFPIIHSDLFNTIPVQAFDIIVINPPYYKKNPVSEADHAWYCGENGEYFTKLFSSLKDFMDANSLVMMVLADVCDIELIKAIALRHNFVLKTLSEHKLLLEKNFVFEVRPVNLL